MRYYDFIRDFIKFKFSGDRRVSVYWKDRRIVLNEDTPTTTFDRHYVYYPAWAARILAETKPKFHVDFSSSLAFGSIVSAFVPIRFYDFRPANLRLDNFKTDSADLTKLPFGDGEFSSVSCLHVIEHIGLGRYGDLLDSKGDLNAIKELQRVVRPDGQLLLVVPVGRPRIVFNAHRIYSFRQIKDQFKGWKLKEFALIPDSDQDGGLIRQANPELVVKQRYGCGCFWFKKKN